MARAVSKTRKGIDGSSVGKQVIGIPSHSGVDTKERTPHDNPRGGTYGGTTKGGTKHTYKGES